MSAAVCPLRRCRGVLSIEVVAGGRVVTSCPQCDRRRAGLCRDCPRKVYGTVGKAVRCEECAAKKRIADDKRHRVDPDVKRRIAARDRKRYRKNESYRERKRRQRREWYARHRDEVRRKKRRFLMSEGPSKEKYLETQRRHNADPARRERKRQYALAHYYQLHPVRPDPHCAGCKQRIEWNGRQRPAKWCDGCCTPAELKRRMKLGRSIAVIAAERVA